MRVIFLDIDGVLTNASKLCGYWRTRLPCSGIPGKTYAIAPFAPDCVERFNWLVAQTGADVCLSSTWGRLFQYRALTAYVAEQGVVCNIIGRTPVRLRRCRPRGSDIQQWLDEWQGEPVKSFVILDDHNDMVHLRDRLVLTRTDEGLQDTDVDKAIHILDDVISVV